MPGKASALKLQGLSYLQVFIRQLQFFKTMFGNYLSFSKLLV
jgi:hypothetical protein